MSGETHGGMRGFREFMQYPLIDALYHRRTRRVSAGIEEVKAGSLTFKASSAEPQPLTALEEAILIAVTGATGITIPDRPFESEDGSEKIMGAPNLHMSGRSAGSPDNAQATHFFMINDSGTYFLKRLETKDADLSFTPENLLKRAEAAKVQVLDKRIDFPRAFPFYLDSNRFLSNKPGTTIFFPVVDMTRQYINAMMYLLTQPDGQRPAIRDDRNFYLYAGTRKWVKNGFLNKDIKLPLGMLGKMRTHYESFLLVENLMLVAQAMGLGPWIHASITPAAMLGHPLFSELAGHNGLGFDYHTPRFSPMDQVRWGIVSPKARSHPVGLKGCFQGLCPPYQNDMRAAVDELMEQKFGSDGLYSDTSRFEQMFKGDFAAEYVKQVPHYEADVIECTKDICTYIFDTHRRFPAHCNAVHVPGIWLQTHYLNVEYYDHLFKGSLTEAQRNHAEWWQGETQES